ncbi:MAG TPA: hypothetical protein VGK19_14520 [Capsulimonadaceae bacterium]|jgi:prepilin-type processing-associated H-X9-DG protein
MTEPTPIKRWVYFLLGMLAAGVIIAPIYQHYEGDRLKSLCISNLKRIGIAELQYTRDYDEMWPPAKRWSTALLPYVEGSVYNDTDRSAKGFGSFGCPAAKGTLYAMNAHTAGSSYSDMENIAALPDHFESTTRLDNYVDLGESVPKPSRHGTGTAVQFVDGHVRLVKTVDCSFIPEPSVHVGSARYPLRTLPDFNAPLEANMQAVFAKELVKLPGSCAADYSNEEITIHPKWNLIMTKTESRAAMRAIYPVWNRYRKAAKRDSDKRYWVTVKWDYTGQTTERVDISKL